MKVKTAMQKRINSLKDSLEEYYASKTFKYFMVVVIIAVVFLSVLGAIGFYGWNEFFVRASKSLVDGLALSMLLFLMVSGFFLIFGLCDVINFAHGAFFMLGGFMGFILYIGTEAILLDPALPLHFFFAGTPFVMSNTAFAISAIGSTAILALIGGGIEYFTIRRLYGNAVGQILLTVGFMFIITQVSDIIWGTSIITYFFAPNSQIEYFFISGWCLGR